MKIEEKEEIMEVMAKEEEGKRTGGRGEDN